MTRSVLAFAALVLTTITAAPSAIAHEGRPIHITVTAQSVIQYEVRWKIPPVLRSSEVPAVSLLGGDCAPVTEPVSQLKASALFRCTSSPTAVSLDFPDYNPALSTLVEYRQLDGAQYSLFVGPELRTIDLPDEQSFGAVATQYLTAGFDHILEGFDHLLFVFCLLLVVGSFGRIFWAVTGFTLGHSVTLGLTALYGISLPPPFVEPLIALSIAMLAAEKLIADKADVSQKPMVFRYPAVIATLFGLLHGFGFGGALSEIGLPYGYALTALAFFNIGVEVGQVAFILVVLSVAVVGRFVLRMPKSMPPMLAKALLYPAGILAGYWTVERVASIWV